MQLLEDMADELARETLKRLAASGDEKIISEVAEILGSSSQTLQEAYLTAVRVRRAEARAREFFRTYDDKLRTSAAKAPG